jgi:DnaJ-class molecular chaperone
MTWEAKAAPVATPIKCPVCEGHGTVPAGFYPDPPETICRACQGTGLIR